MKAITLLPADMYQVINKSLLNECDKIVLNILYMPIIGNEAISFYNTLYNELKINSFISNELTHHHLMSIMNFKLAKIKECRIKLEGIGLLKTYYLEGNVNSYVYELYSPLSANEFFNHPIFNVVLFNNIGKEEYNRLVNYFEIPEISLKKYTDITSPFNMTFESKNYTNLEIENKNIISKDKLKLNYELDYDFDFLKSLMPKNIFNEKSLNKSAKELIINLAFLYELDELSMSEIIKTCLTVSGGIDKEGLRKKARKYYTLNNSNKLPSLIFKHQPEYLKSPEGDNTRQGKLIKVFEDNTPYEFLLARNKGIKPSEREMQILEVLLVDFKLNPSVVNVLIDYVLKSNNNKLIKNYIEVIASQWKRLNIETAKEAMEIAEKEHNKYKKNTKVTKNSEKTPVWFNKNIEKKEVTAEENKELEELLMEYRS